MKRIAVIFGLIASFASLYPTPLSAQHADSQVHKSDLPVYGIGRLHNEACAALMQQLGADYHFDTPQGFAATIAHLSPAAPTLPQAEALVPALMSTLPESNVQSAATRAPIYQALQLPALAVQYLEALFSLPDDLSYTGVQTQIQTLGLQAHQDVNLDAQSKHLVLMTYELSASSATLWHNHYGEDGMLHGGPTYNHNLIGDFIAKDTTKPDSVRRVPFGKLFKADGFGLLKGVLSGLVIYVLGNLFKLPEVPFIIGGAVVAVAWPIFDSLWYSSRYRKGLIKEENPEFFY